MKNKQLADSLVLIIYCVVVFVVSLFVISKIMNQGNVDMTTKMSDASFPTLSFICDDKEYNLLHGYSNTMDVTHMRDSITTVGTDRKLKFKIKDYDSTISGISFELRGSNGERLIEESEVHDYVRESDGVSGTISIKDLILEHTEYSLCVNVETTRGQVIHYYTKLIEADDYNLSEKLDFAYMFSESTFDKEVAAEQITTYVESNEKGDNTTFNHVDIHSSLDQITWGDLDVKKETEPVATVSQIDQSTTIINLTYFVSTSTPSKENYRVTEMFRLRLGDERMYLLDYQRTMSQVFKAKTSNIVNNKIELGINSQDVNMMESSDGKKIAFVNEGRLFSYNVAENKLAYVFGFFEDVKDDRATYNLSDIKIFNIDEKGNIYFMVYGYMNRGNHEGEMGCLVSYYDSGKNSVEELTFIPSKESYDIIKDDVKDLSYIDSNEVLYILIGSSIYEIKLEDNQLTEIAQFQDEKSYVVSSKSNMAAWVNNGYSKSVSMNWINNENGEVVSIAAPEGDYIRPVGFFDNDLIYGLCHKKDIAYDISGREIFPMYQLNIVDNELNVIKSYDPGDTFVTDFTSEGNYMINLTRMKKDVSGNICDKAVPDQLIDNISASAMKNEVTVVAIDKYEKVVEIAFNKEVDNNKTQILSPRQVLFEGDREITIERTSLKGMYYVYVKGAFQDSYDNLADAASYAYNNGGAVYGDDGRVLYQKTTLLQKNQIMAITGNSINDGENETMQTAVCINTILEYEGITGDVRGLMSRGTGAIQTLAQKMEDATVLDFSGCQLDIMLYYVEKDIPVLALMKDGSAYLIIGYNEFNVVLMDPVTGTVYKKGMNDSKTLFEANGNRFVTYIRDED